MHLLVTCVICLGPWSGTSHHDSGEEELRAGALAEEAIEQRPQQPAAAGPHEPGACGHFARLSPREEWLCTERIRCWITGVHCEAVSEDLKVETSAIPLDDLDKVKASRYAEEATPIPGSSELRELLIKPGEAVRGTLPTGGYL